MQGTFFRHEPTVTVSSLTKVDGKVQIHVLFRRYATLANLPPAHRHVHPLSHSIATHLLDAGEAIDFVKDHLGHRTIESALVYARISDRRRTRAVRRLERSLGV
jgi:integrase